MVQRPPLSDHGFPTGNVVRGPSAADGVGVALRNIFTRDAALPPTWDDYLRRLDHLPRC